ncbi:glutaredoxin family protein [bacterium]|nr:glutaredoxin family protein [bacterium]
MEIVHVAGEDRGEIMLYTLSTCVWCRKMKRWLDEKGFAYSYVDVDLESVGEKEAVMEEVERWNPLCSFPTVVVGQRECFVGFKPERIVELIGK